MKSRLAAALAASLVFPPGLFAAPSLGAVKGQVSLEGRPLAGLVITLVDVTTGAVHSVKTTESGWFELSLAPGSYVVTSRSRGGLAVGRGPTLVTVQSGRVASASVELIAVAAAMQEPAQTTGANIGHEAIGCLVANEFPIFEAKIEPAAIVVRARVYFRSVLSEEWYYVEMTQAEGLFTGILPRPTMAAGPITYYLQVTTTDFGEGRIPEISAEVVLKAEDCPDDKLVGPFGQPPPGGVTLFSASTGAAAGLPTGFVAGGALLGTGALIGLGALILGTTIAVTGGTPTPTPTPAPPAPPPPPPGPTPSPTPFLTVIPNCEVRPTATGNPTGPAGTQFITIGSCVANAAPPRLQSEEFGSITINAAPIASVASVDPDFPRAAWEQIVCRWSISENNNRAELLRLGLRPGTLTQCPDKPAGSTSCSINVQADAFRDDSRVNVNFTIVYGWRYDPVFLAVCRADNSCSVAADTCETELTR